MVYPSTSKALRFSSRAGDLQLRELEVRPLSASEILVKVHAASINPVDVQLWNSGLVAVVAGDKGIGRDFSGTVVSVGRDVRGWAEGDDIFGLLFKPFGEGTFSQYLNINPTSIPVAKKPNCFSHAAAASIPLVALTAYACLDWLPPPGASQRRVIVRGASGGTGSWIVQLAKVVYDCHVTAICSANNADYVKSIGADEIIDYTSQDVVQTLLSTRVAGHPMDLIIDCVGGTEVLSVYEQLLHSRGAYVTIVGDKTSVTSLGGPITYITNPVQILRYIHGFIFGPRYACISMLMKSEYLERVAALGERGEVKCEVQEVIKGAFDEDGDSSTNYGGWKRAIKLIESSRIRGKVILEVP